MNRNINSESSSDQSGDEEEIFRNFDAEAQLIIQEDLLPKKSGDRYMLVYNNYKKWETEHKNMLSSSHEKNLIVYFKELKLKVKPPTLWSIWSMLRTTLNLQENVDISNFANLKSFLKTNSKGYKPKKSAVFKWNDVESYINNAPDYACLSYKVALIFGICGALRCDEFVHLLFRDVEDLGNKFIVSVRDTKNDFDRQFIIGPLYYKKIKQYIHLRPVDTDCPARFFIHYSKGKCTRQVMGKNKISEIPKLIAEYLEIPEPKRFTGHCYRRTASTLLSDSGASVQMLKQLGGWRSEKIALGYVESSMLAKQNIFDGIVHGSKSGNQQHLALPAILTPVSTAPLASTSSDIRSNSIPATSTNHTQNLALPSASTGILESTSSFNDNAGEKKLNESVETPVLLQWEDFVDDFTIDDDSKSAPPALPTVPSVNKDSCIGIFSDILENIPKQQQRTASSGFATAAGVDIALTETMVQEEKTASHPAKTSTNKHFLEKESIKLNFKKSDDLEPPSKKKVSANNSETRTSKISFKTFNNEVFDDIDPQKFVHCNFNNCTFNFNA